MTPSDLRVISPVSITDAMFVSSTIAETDYAAWSSGTAYVVGDRVRYVSTDVHKVFESIQNGTNKNPTTETTYWTEVGPTNRWKMFDMASGTVSTDASPVEVVIEPGRVDSIALLDVDAHTARVRLSTTAEGTFYDETYTLTGAQDVIEDWYDYFYEPIGTRSALVLSGLAQIEDVTITLTLTRTAGNVSLGNFVVGTSTYLGLAEHGVRTGITDYSSKSEDAFGRVTLVERAYAKRLNITAKVRKNRVDVVLRKLAALRASLCVLSTGNPLTSYDALQVFGWLRDFEEIISGPEWSTLSIDFRGIA